MYTSWTSMSGNVNMINLNFNIQRGSYVHIIDFYVR